MVKLTKEIEDYHRHVDALAHRVRKMNLDLVLAQDELGHAIRTQDEMIKRHYRDLDKKD